MAREFSGRSNVLLFTDRLESSKSVQGVEVIALGRAADNVAIVHANRTRELEGKEVIERVFVTLQAFSRSATTRTLVITGATRELARRLVTLSPGSREHLSFPLPKGFGVIHVRLLEADALAIDNSVTLAPVPVRELVIATNLEVEAALALGLGDSEDPLAQLIAALPDARATETLAEADLLLSDRDGPWAVSGELRLHGHANGQERNSVGPFLVDRGHALLSGTTFEGILWSLNPRETLPGLPLVSAGETPILTEQIRAGRRIFHLNLLPERSGLPRSPDWAIPLANWAELQRAELPGPAACNLAVGEEFLFHGAGKDDFVLEEPGGARRTLEARANVLAIEDLWQPGLYSLLHRPEGPGEPQRVARFAVRFGDAVESDLSALSSGTSFPEDGGTASIGRIVSAGGPFELIALVVLLVLLLTDWWFLERGQRPLPSLFDRRGASGTSEAL